MKLFMKAALLCLFVFGCTLLLVGCGNGANNGEPEEDDVVTTDTNGDWWLITDSAFVSQYKDLATGTQVDRSKFAWMLFARINQMEGAYTVWESWPANVNTFPPSDLTARTGPQLHHSAKSNIGGQEVTRNLIAYNYIKDRELYKKATVEAILGTATANGSPRVDLPEGAIAIKAQWTPSPDSIKAGMYTIAGEGGTEYGLMGIHIMIKIQTYPDGPRPVAAPSWFWTTFEYANTPLRAKLIQYITFRDALPPDERETLVTQSGLASPLSSYLCNGTQTRFVAEDGTVAVVLGNSHLENAFIEYGRDGTTIVGWNTSCHTCHYEAYGNASNLLQAFIPFTGDYDLPEGMYEDDFDWSINLFAQ